MAKKRKLEAKSEPQEVPAASSNGATDAQPEPSDEPIVEASQEPAPIEEPAADADEIVPEEEAKPETLPELGCPSSPSAPSAANAEPEPAPGAANGEQAFDDEPEPVQKLLEPLSKEQLIDLLSGAAEKHVDVMAEVQKIADSDPAHRKIFVHGLGWDTNSDTLIAAFSQYGEIEDCKAVRDKATGKSKGYGFILFKNRSGARKALKEPQKKIGNRMTSCQLASAGPVPAPPPAAAPVPVPAPTIPVSEYTQRKIYISNVSADIDPQKLLQFFAKFGEIEEGPLGLDKQTGKPKGFTLFVYKTIDSAKKALEEPHKNFEGHILHCQKAIDGPKPNKPGWNQQQSWGAHSQGVHHVSGGSAKALGSHFGRGAQGAGFGGGMGGHMHPSGSGHLMAPSQPGFGYNQAQPAAAGIGGVSPGFGQGLPPSLTNSAPGMGLTSVLGGGHGMQSAYGNQGAGSGYGGQASAHSGYGTMGQGGSGRGQQGYMGGFPPYMGH